MYELRNVWELKALLLDSFPLQEWGIYGDRFDNLIAQVRKEAKAEALRDAANSGLFVGPIADMLEARADQMEGDE